MRELTHVYARGTVLGSARGGFDAEVILSKLKEWGVSMLFIIGGDGTHRGAHKLQLEIARWIMRIGCFARAISADSDFCRQAARHDTAHSCVPVPHRCRDNIAVVGVPKTIDNDIGLIDRSFGFNTAVEEACKAVGS